jgi:hypothetical protein
MSFNLPGRRGAAGRAAFLRVAGTISVGRCKTKVDSGQITDSHYSNIHPLQVLTFAEIVNTLVGKRVVVVLPRELSLDETAGGQGLHSLNDLQVGDINVLVLGEVVVLGGNQNAVYDTGLEFKEKNVIHHCD